MNPEDGRNTADDIASTGDSISTGDAASSRSDLNRGSGGYAPGDMNRGSGANAGGGANLGGGTNAGGGVNLGSGGNQSRVTNTASRFVPLNSDGLSIVPRLDGDALRVDMSGVVEMRDPGQTLNPYWLLIDEEARRLGLKSIHLDIRNLSFMNSSGILTLVRWIVRCKSAPAGYHIMLHYDRSLTWQRASVPTLAKLAPNVVVPMEIDG